MLLKNGVFRWCWQEHVTASPRASQFLSEKISFFIGKEEGCLCWAWRTQDGSSEQTWQSVMVRDKWVEKDNYSVT